MANEGNWSQSLSDKKYQYYGSYRNFYSGCGLGSTAAWAFLNFSGTNTGFGAANNVLANRYALVSSGNSFIQWSWNSGITLGGELYGGQAFTQDGVNASGVWIRSNAASQLVKMWAW